MTERTARLREASIEAVPTVSHERAGLVTDFYLANEGRHSVPVMRARCFEHLCGHKTIWIGEGELIVGERGPAPKAVPTYPELTCHSIEDLEILNSRPKTRYSVPEECIRVYREKVIPYWRGRNMRDRMFDALPGEWQEAYEAGIFTEFMEQRAPGHTVLDDKIYRKGRDKYVRPNSVTRSLRARVASALGWLARFDRVFPIGRRSVPAWARDRSGRHPPPARRKTVHAVTCVDGDCGND